MASPNLRDLRCHACGALLLKEDVREGHVQVKCHYCNAMGEYRFTEGRRAVTREDPGSRRPRRIPG